MMMSYQSMEERKFVCKYCSKRFPCGKSLGGHIRTHMMNEHHHRRHHHHDQERRISNNNAAANAMLMKFDGGRKRKRDLGSEENGVGGGNSNNNNNMNYGLRENPKKTTRFVHSNATLQLDKFCKECGKGFPSLKALCGHMACHSEKDKSNNNNNRFETEKQKLLMDSESDTETSSAAAPIRRSKRMKYKTLSISSSNNNQNQNQQPQSSSVSEVEQEQQEEVARCLMMLSKDSSYKGRFAALLTESSDNNSVVLEAKSSPSLETKVTTMMMMNNSSNNGENSMSKMEHKDLKLKFKSAEIGYGSDNSDSGYFRYGPKLDDSNDDVFFRNNNEVKSSKVGYLTGFEDYDVESRKVLSRGRSRGTEFKKFKKSNNYDEVNGFVAKYDQFLMTSERDNGGSDDDDDSAYESDENSTDTESYPAPKAHGNNNNNLSSSGQKGKKKLKLKSKKKSKAHECPICNKIFRSGQALGGHKRSHFIGGSEENTLVIRPSAPPVPVPVPVPFPCLIDLNLPAPVDE